MPAIILRAHVLHLAASLFGLASKAAAHELLPIYWVHSSHLRANEQYEIIAHNANCIPPSYCLPIPFQSTVRAATTRPNTNRNLCDLIE